MQRKPLSATILAAVFFAGPVAAESNYQITYGQGINLKKVDRPEGAGTLRDRARQAVMAVREAGYLAPFATVDHDRREVHVSLASAERKGELAAYLPDEIVYAEELTDRYPLMAEAALARGGEATVDVDQVDDGQVPVTADVKPSDRPYKAGVMISSYGPRYSGENVASAFVQGGFKGFSGSLTYSEGLAFLTPDEAKGGHYHGISGEIKRPTPYGVPVFGFQYADYKQGGDARVFDLNGTNARINLGYEHPFTWGTPSLNLVHGRQTSDIGLVDVDGAQRYTAIEAGFEVDKTVSGTGFWKTNPMTVNVEMKATQGLWTDTSGTALGRADLDDDFVVGAMDVLINQTLAHDLMVALAFGGQAQDGLQPNQMDFYLGGINRGSGYRSGSGSSLDGAYGSLRVYSPNVRTELWGLSYRARPFVGYNQASGEQALGGTLRAASAELGTQVQIDDYLSGEIGYAWITDDQGPHEDDGRWIFNLVSRF